MIRMPFPFRCGLVAFLTLFVTSLAAQPITPGNMLTFGGTTNDYVIATNFSGFPTTAATVELWMNSTATNIGGLFSYATTANANAFLLINPAQLEVRVNGVLAYQLPTPLNDGAWHHVAATWTNSGGVNVYIDGVLRNASSVGVQTVLTDGALVLGQDQDTVGGGFSTDQAYKGRLDEVRIWNHVRTTTEIRNNMNVAISNSVPGLVAYYRLDGAGPVYTNSAAFTNHLVSAGTVTLSPSTVPFAPAVASTNAVGITATNATLQTIVYANNFLTTGRFEWGTGTTPYQNTNQVTSIAATSNAVTASLTVSNLTYGTTYHYRFVATNTLGTAVESDQTFVAGVLTVTNLFDSGLGSLRRALLSAGDGARIIFGTNGTIPLTNGALLIDNDVILQGPGTSNLIIDASSSSRIFEISAGATVQMSDLTLKNGHAPNAATIDFGGIPGGHGGAIMNAGIMTLSNCIVTNCRAGNGAGSFFGNLGAGHGGALYNSGTATLLNSVLSYNTAGRAINGDFSAGPSGGAGGAIYNTGTLTLTRCSLIGNASGAGGDGLSGNGGPGGNGSAILNVGPLNASLCTISGNISGAGGAKGFNANDVAGPSGEGCIMSGNPGTITLRACTVVSNLVRGGISTTMNASDATIHNSIIAANSGYDVSGVFNSQGHNLIGAVDGALGFVNGVKSDLTGTSGSPLNAMVGPLAMNGGLTPTHAILGGSPAIDAGDDTLTSLVTDQRGAVRLSGQHVDIGAVEQDFTGWPAMTVTTLGATVAAEPISGESKVTFSAAVLPGPNSPKVTFQYGLTTAYGSSTAATSVPAGTNSVQVNAASASVGEGYTLHYRAVATAGATVLNGLDKTVYVPFRNLPGDTDRDGTISDNEVQGVLSNYFPSTPWLQMTNTAGLGTTNISFGLSNALTATYNVEVSTNLVDWTLLGPALPRYDFLDTNAVDNVQRYYRLRLP